MSVQFRPQPPPVPIHEDTRDAEVRRARRLWEGRAGTEGSEDDVIHTILNVEGPNVKPELRGAHRADAKATLSWLVLARVLAVIEPGRFRWAEEFPEWPQRSWQAVQARDAELMRQQEEEELRRVEEAQREDWQRHNPRDRELEERLRALEDRVAEQDRELRSLKRRRESESTDARLRTALNRKAANRGRDTTDLPGHAGEEITHVHDPRDSEPAPAPRSP
jgi:hypothetical protein